MKYLVINNRGVHMRVFDTKVEAEEYSDYINDMERDICTWVEPMSYKLSITKSRAGHYTVTIRDHTKTLVMQRRLISTLPQAQEIASTWLNK